MEIFMSVLFNAAATGHTWMAVSMWKVASVKLNINLI